MSSPFPPDITISIIGPKKIVYKNKINRPYLTLIYTKCATSKACNVHLDMSTLTKKLSFQWLSKP